MVMVHTRFKGMFVYREDVELEKGDGYLVQQGGWTSDMKLVHLWHCQLHIAIHYIDIYWSEHQYR